MELTDSTSNSQRALLGGLHNKKFLNREFTHKLPNLADVTVVKKKLMMS